MTTTGYVDSSSTPTGPADSEFHAAVPDGWIINGAAEIAVPIGMQRIVVLLPRHVAANLSKGFTTALSAAPAAVKEIRLGDIGQRLAPVFDVVKDADAVVVLNVDDAGAPEPRLDESRRFVWVLHELNRLVRQLSTMRLIIHAGGIPLVDEKDRIYEQLFYSDKGLRNARELEFLAPQVINAVAATKAMQLARSVERKERQERIEQKASAYIQETLAALRKREAHWKIVAMSCHVLGFVSLVVGIVAVVTLAASAAPAVESPKWPLLVYLGIKSVIVVALLVASSKYAFTIGKAYMSEALKTADRIHAIGLGDFYLKAYGDSATWTELKDVFATWNIARDSGFAALDANQFDPQLLEKGIEIAKMLTPSQTEKRLSEKGDK